MAPRSQTAALLLNVGSIASNWMSQSSVRALPMAASRAACCWAGVVTESPQPHAREAASPSTSDMWLLRSCSGATQVRSLWSSPRRFEKQPGSAGTEGIDAGSMPSAAGDDALPGGERRTASDDSASPTPASSTAAGPTPGSSTAAGPTPGSSTAAGPSALAVHSPLQSLMDAAAEEPAVGSGRGAAPPLPRTWVWYDEEDERTEQKRERRALAERYADAGVALRTNVDHSIKKMNRVLNLVRGLSYVEAVHQCRLQPLKAARVTLECLERAYEDAKEKGLDCGRLVVATIFATKGQYDKSIRPHGRGNTGLQLARKSHVTVALREAREEPGHRGPHEALLRSLTGPIGRGRRAPRGTAFGVRVVPPAMAYRVRMRPRFAYTVEV